MAMVTRCDRCGKIIENPSKLKIREHSTEYRIEREYNLCDECREKLEVFLNGGEIVDEQSGIDG